MLKSKLREKILKIRQNKNKNNIQINFKKIFDIIKKQKINNKNIGGYFPVNFEVDDLEILKNFERKNFKISLPVIKKNFQMDFYQWSFTEILKINKYGIPEPEAKNLIYPEILLVPLVGFDLKLNRLGYGGGFYDRTLQALRARRATLAIGFAYAAQQTEHLPLEATDQQLDFIVTERGVIEI